MSASTVQREPYTRVELLDEWQFLRDTVRFHDFPARVGISAAAWDKAFRRAAAAGDPRAVKPRRAP